MRIYKTRPFARWAKKEKVSDQVLRSVVSEMEKGQVVASLGGHLYKQRVALGKGKRGGARVIVAFAADDKSFFIYGFLKNETDNITSRELNALKAYAKQLLLYSTTQLKEAVLAGELYEIT